MILRAALILSLIGCGASATSAPAPAPPIPPSTTDAPGYSFATEQLAPHIFALYQRGFHAQPRGNVEVIEQSRGVVLVDSGGSPAGAVEVIAFVRSHTRKPVTAIILTHWHGDHTLGVSRLLQEWPRARVISTEATRDMLANPLTDRFMPGDNAEANARLQHGLEETIAFLAEQGRRTDTPAPIHTGYATAAHELERYARETSAARRVAPTETFTDHVDLPDRVAPVHVMFLGPANTQGDAIVWLPSQRVLITGDTVVSPIPYGFNSYLGSWIDVLRRLRGYDFSVLMPGHGAPMRNKDYLDRLIELMTQTRAQVAAVSADAAVTAENAPSHVDLTALRARFTGEDLWLQRWFTAYWTRPAISSALREARGQPVIQGSP